MPLLWSGIALVVLGLVLTAQELRWFHTERADAFAEAMWDLITRHVVKALLGPALMLAGAFILHRLHSGAGFWDLVGTVWRRENSPSLRFAAMEAAGATLVLWAWVSSTDGPLLPDPVQRVLAWGLQALLGLAWLATAWWNVTHIGGHLLADALGGLLLLAAFAEIRDGIVHGAWGSGISISYEGGESSWWIGLTFWQDKLERDRRPVFYALSVLLTLVVAALFAFF